MLFETGQATHRGAVRERNEDACLALSQSGLWVVADGMGGHDAGDVASGLIVEELSSIGIPASAQDLQARAMQRIGRAHDRIRAHAEAHRLGSIGSTVVMLLAHQGAFACLWSGDSRIYLLRAGQLARQTEDHTEVAELLRTGQIDEAEARHWPRRNVITRAVGAMDDPGIEIVSGHLRDGDMFLLCSDGLTGCIEDAELAAALAMPDPVQTICDGLVAETLRRGAPDNVTAIVVRVREGG